MVRTRNPFILFIAIPLLGLALSLAGCNSGTEEPDAPAAPAGTTSPATDMADDAADSSSSRPADEIDSARFPEELGTGAVAAIPDLYPSDLPIYPGAVAAQGKSVSLDGNDMSAVQFLSNDEPDRAYDSYLQDLGGRGWVVNPDAKNPAKNSVEVKKGDCTATVFFAPAASGSGTDIFTVTECSGTSS